MVAKLNLSSKFKYFSQTLENIFQIIFITLSNIKKKNFSWKSIFKRKIVFDTQTAVVL
jgi:hypothetical protein